MTNAVREAARGDAIFVGRESELETLRELARQAAAGRTRIALIRGDPGIGKTRLAEVFADEVSREGVAVRWGRCHEGEGGPPFWPWVSALRDGAAGETLRQIVGGADVTGGAADAQRFRLFDDVVRHLRRLAVDRALLVVLDDLHAADDASLLLLRFVSRELTDARVLLVATHREREPGVRLAFTETVADLAPRATRIAMHGLGHGGVAALVQAQLGAEPSPMLIDALLERSDGNPFFVGELVRLLGDTPDLVPSRVPEEVRAVLRRRLVTVAPETRRLLCIASVLGRELDLGLLAALAGRERAACLDALEEAVEQGLLHPAGEQIGAHRFVHVLLRDTLYDDLQASERCDLHARAVQCLEAAGAASSSSHHSALAHHAFLAAQGGDASRALDYCEAAAVRANETWAYEEAALQYHRALAALDWCPSDPCRRLRLLLGLADAQASSGLADLARDSFRQAASLARSEQRREEFCRAAIGYAVHGESGAPDRQRIALLEDALAWVGDEPLELRLRVMSRLAGALYFTDRLVESLQLVRAAVALAPQTEDARAWLGVVDAARSFGWQPDDARHRLGLTSDLIDRGRRSGRGDLEASGQLWRSEVLAELGDVAASEAACAEARRIAERLRSQPLLWEVELMEILFRTLRGDLDEAADRIVATRERGRRVQPDLADQWAAVQHGEIALLRERYDEIEPAMRLFAARYSGGTWPLQLGRVLARMGRIDELRAMAEPWRATLPAALRRDLNWPVSMAALAEIAAALGDAAWAQALHREFACFDGHHVVVALQVTYDGPASLYLGMLAATAGDRDAARLHLEAASACCDRIGAQPHAARARAELARLLGEPAAAGDGARVATFRREGDYWTVAFEDRSRLVQDLRGMRLIARLLAEPGREFLALDLDRDDTGTTHEPHPLDLPRGPGWRAGSPIERARVRVTRAIATAQKKLEAEHPPLAKLLRDAIRTGTTCSYRPAPGHALRWEL